jgi:cytochrome c553
MNKTLLLIALVALSSSAFGKGDPVAGEQKSAPCQACHLKDGNSSDPQYPRLAGQYHDYLEHSLRAYKTGERNHAVMKGFADVLTEQDIEDLSAFYAVQGNGLVELSED